MDGESGGMMCKGSEERLVAYIWVIIDCDGLMSWQVYEQEVGRRYGNGNVIRR
jgi:hypothetical protein